MKKHAFATVALAVVISWGAASVRAEIIEQILVKVNGEIFTKTDLENAQVQTLRQRGQQIDLKNDPSDAQLRKALDDCTQSLRYGSIPDAFQKQQELVKRLGGNRG